MPAPVPRVDVVEISAPTRSELPMRFVSAPFMALTTIEVYAPRPGERWPPLTSKHGGMGHGMIWDAPVLIGSDAYWHANEVGWVAQSRTLDPAGLRVRAVPGNEPLGRLLTIHGDQLITARRVEGAETSIEILAALVEAPEASWPLCTLYWPEWAVQRALSVWYQYAGPVVVGDEIVMLGERGIVHASLLDCATRVLATEHEVRVLTPGRDRVAWRQDDGYGRWSIALDEFSRVIHLPYTGLADWAGDTLIIEHEDRLLRWAEDAIVELELPGPAGPTGDRRWLADGEVLWIYEPGKPLWRIDGEGFVGLDLDLEWPTEVAARDGVLIWAIARADHMEVLSTWPGVGLGLDRALLRP